MRDGDGILAEIWSLMMNDPQKNLRLPDNNAGLNRVLRQSGYAWVGGRGVLTFAVNKMGKAY